MRTILAALAVLACAGCAGDDKPQPLPTLDCHVGAYRLDDGRVIDLAPSAEGRVRWRLMDGTTGSAPVTPGVNHTTLGFSQRQSEHTLDLLPCAGGQIRFDSHEGARVPLDVVNSTFESDGNRLAGRLVMPQGDAAVPVIVMIGGAELDSDVFWTFRQNLYPAQGVGVFVYDQRGTGASGGQVTENTLLLAHDAAAAAREARRLAGARVQRLGYLGGSQGGTVAPRAQRIYATDFLIVEYGLAIPSVYVDRDLIVDDLRRAGYPRDVQIKGGEIGNAIAVLVASNYTRGWDEFFALRDRYKHEPWFSHIEGDYADAFLNTPPIVSRVVFPIMDYFTDKGADWTYNPMPTLRAIDAPQLWLVAGSDTVSPEATTHRNLARLVAEGRNISIVEYPNADHVMIEYDGPNDGSHPGLRYSAGYLDAALNFARGDVPMQVVSPTP